MAESFVLRVLEPASSDGRKPFRSSDQFDDRWWPGRQIGSIDRNRYISVWKGNAEVARAHLDITTRVSEDFGLPNRDERFVEFVFLEVARDQRCVGLGTEVVGLIAALYPRRAFAAFSEGADGFWSSLGWARFEHLEHARRYRPIYVSWNGMGAPSAHA